MSELKLADLPKAPGHEDHSWSYSLCWTCYCQGKIVNRPGLDADTGPTDAELGAFDMAPGC